MVRELPVVGECCELPVVGKWYMSYLLLASGMGELPVVGEWYERVTCCW